MDYSEILSKTGEYLTKFVDAAIPVAKQAYEIGLLTIRVDAAQTLIPTILVLVISILVFRKCLKVYKDAKAVAVEKKIMDYWGDPAWVKAGNIPMDGAAVCIPWVLSCLGIVISAGIMCNIWLWIQLFKPELWLAKQAINAVLSAGGAK